MRKCDVCNRKLKYAEIYISACIDGEEEQLNECIPCAEKNPDPNKHKGITWIAYYNK